MRPTRRAASLLACTLAASCVHYSSIQSADGKIYLSGAKSFWFISIPFLKRCDLDGTTLHCEELEEYKPEPAKSGAPGGNEDGTPEADSDGEDEAEGEEEAASEKDEGEDEGEDEDEDEKDAKTASKPKKEQ